MALHYSELHAVGGTIQIRAVCDDVTDDLEVGGIFGGTHTHFILLLLFKILACCCVMAAPFHSITGIASTMVYYTTRVLWPHTTMVAKIS